MLFLELVKVRQSVREYSEKPVEQYKITRCLEAARMAPSSRNDQPWEFLVIDDLLLKDAVAKDTFGTVAGVPINRFTLESPVLILVISDKPSLIARIGGIFRARLLSPVMGVGMTVAYFCLQAAEEGLGTCILGHFHERKIKKRLQIPASKQINLIISLGYPKSNEIRYKVRKELSQIVNYNQYRYRQ
ncbi:MAG: nitroreductase family protein [Firmicutes bacterium]|nr:nitroreductase family protein [Bacillota bacterium]